MRRNNQRSNAYSHIDHSYGDDHQGSTGEVIDCWTEETPAIHPNARSRSPKFDHRESRGSRDSDGRDGAYYPPFDTHSSANMARSFGDMSGASSEQIWESAALFGRPPRGTGDLQGVNSFNSDMGSEAMEVAVHIDKFEGEMRAIGDATRMLSVELITGDRSAASRPAQVTVLHPTHMDTPKGAVFHVGETLVVPSTGNGDLELSLVDPENPRKVGRAFIPKEDLSRSGAGGGGVRQLSVSNPDGKFIGRIHIQIPDARTVPRPRNSTTGAPMAPMHIPAALPAPRGGRIPVGRSDQQHAGRDQLRGMPPPGFTVGMSKPQELGNGVIFSSEWVGPLYKAGTQPPPPPAQQRVPHAGAWLPPSPSKGSYSYTSSSSDSYSDGSDGSAAERRRRKQRKRKKRRRERREAKRKKEQARMHQNGPGGGPPWPPGHENMGQGPPGWDPRMGPPPPGPRGPHGPIPSGLPSPLTPPSGAQPSEILATSGEYGLAPSRVSQHTASSRGSSGPPGLVVNPPPDGLNVSGQGGPPPPFVPPKLHPHQPRGPQPPGGGPQPGFGPSEEGDGAMAEYRDRSHYQPYNLNMGVRPRNPFDQPHETFILKVTVISATNLRRMDLMGVNDCYVIVRLGECEARTRVISSERPVWDETFELPLTLAFHRMLEVAVYDEDSVGGGDLIGLTNVYIADLPFGDGGGVQRAISLTDPKSGSFTGTICLLFSGPAMDC